MASMVGEGVAAFRAHGADAVIGFGGGAALDIAKVVAMMATNAGNDVLEYAWDHPHVRPILNELPPFVALPTTSGTGSEVGRSSVVSDDTTHVKKIVFSPKLLAKVVFADPVSALPHINAGTLLALAVTSKDRSPVAPEVPTISESGYGGFDAIAWHGILAPAHTPPAIIDRLNAEIVKALKEPETRSLLEKQAMQIVGSSPEAFASFIKQDIAIWKEVADQAKVEVR